MIVHSILTLLRRKAAAFGIMATLAPVTAMADSAAILFPDMCGDPSAIFDYKWSVATGASPNLFLYEPGASIAKVSSKVDLDAAKTVFLFAHGCEQGSIGRVAAADVATQLATDHKSTPDVIFVGSCYGAAALKAINAKYKDAVPKLFGSKDPARLTGNGSADLSKAVYKSGSKETDTKLYNQIIKNIMADWDGSVYKDGKTYAKYCEDLRTAKDKSAMPGFIEDVVKRYSSGNMNYLDLVKLNAGGDDFTQCGGKTACP